MRIAVPSTVLTLTVLGVTYSDALPPKLGQADLLAPGLRGASLERQPGESAVYDSDGLPRPFFERAIDVVGNGAKARR